MTCLTYIWKRTETWRANRELMPRRNMTSCLRMSDIRSTYETTRMPTRWNIMAISVVGNERHQEKIPVEGCGLKPLWYQGGYGKNLFLTEICCENLQELTRLETHVYRKTTNTLIVAKTINVWATTQQIARNNGSTAKQPWVLNAELHNMSKVLFYCMHYWSCSWNGLCPEMHVHILDLCLSAVLFHLLKLNHWLQVLSIQASC